MDNMGCVCVCGGRSGTYLGLSPLPSQDGPLQENNLLGGQTAVAGESREEQIITVVLDKQASVGSLRETINTPPKYVRAVLIEVVIRKKRDCGLCITSSPIELN